jgi:hypothetical protein
LYSDNEIIKTIEIMKIELTQELRNEVLKSIQQFDNLIKKEMLIDADLRKHDKVIIYTNKIIELNQSLVNGFI